MKLKVVFKNDTVIELDDVSKYAIKDDNKSVLRIDRIDGRTHFINFHEVLACLAVKEEKQ